MKSGVAAALNQLGSPRLMLSNQALSRQTSPQVASRVLPHLDIGIIFLLPNYPVRDSNFTTKPRIERILDRENNATPYNKSRTYLIERKQFKHESWRPHLDRCRNQQNGNWEGRGTALEGIKERNGVFRTSDQESKPRSIFPSSIFFINCRANIPADNQCSSNGSKNMGEHTTTLPPPQRPNKYRHQPQSITRIRLRSCCRQLNRFRYQLCSLGRFRSEDIRYWRRANIQRSSAEAAGEEDTVDESVN